MGEGNDGEVKGSAASMDTEKWCMHDIVFRRRLPLKVASINFQVRSGIRKQQLSMLCTWRINRNDRKLLDIELAKHLISILEKLSSQKLNRWNDCTNDVLHELKHSPSYARTTAKE